MTVQVYLAAFRVFFTISTIFFSHFLVLYLDLFINVRRVRNVFQLIVIVESTILSVTLLDNWIVYIVAFLAVITVGVILRSKCSAFKKHLTFHHERPNCITLCRASVFLITAVCISAVDFPIFPSHLSKSKDSIPGLMDTGIGLFVFSIAILPKKIAKANPSFTTIFKSVVPVLALGVMRTVILKVVDYHQDVTEYGLHWNAFLTIGITKLFGEIFCRLVTNKVMLCAAIITLHEIILQAGIGNWTMSFEVGRNTLLEANREGIVSLPGFVAIYLASVHISNILTSSHSVVRQEVFTHKKWRLISLTMVVLFVFVFVIPVTHICRRIANFGYFLWIILIALVMLILFMSLEEHAMAMNKICSKDHLRNFVLPVITESVNYNALFFFLISNVLTGMINMFLNTNGRSSFASFLILNVYMGLVCYSVIYLYERKRRVKW